MNIKIPQEWRNILDKYEYHWNESQEAFVNKRLLSKISDQLFIGNEWSPYWKTPEELDKELATLSEFHHSNPKLYEAVYISLNRYPYRKKFGLMFILLFILAVFVMAFVLSNNILVGLATIPISIILILILLDKIFPPPSYKLELLTDQQILACLKLFNLRYPEELFDLTEKISQKRFHES